MAAPVKPARQKATVLLLGATGQVGLFALPRLLSAGYPVIAVSRRICLMAGKPETPCANGVGWFHPDAVNGAGGGGGGREASGFLQEIQVLLSCGPVELATQIAPRCPQLQRVVCFSTSSVYSKQSSANASERKLIAAIKCSEDALKQSCQARAIALVLLRPTLIYGCGLDRNVSRIARLAKQFHFFPVAGKASGLRQPVHADDLAKLALRLLETADVPTMESPVGGGSVITYKKPGGTGFCRNRLVCPCPADSAPGPGQRGPRWHPGCRCPLD